MNTESENTPKTGASSPPERNEKAPSTADRMLSKMQQMQIVHDFEESMREKAGLNLTDVRDLLGVSKTSWHEYRTGSRMVPEYVLRSIKAHSRLTPFEIECLLSESAESTEQET